MRLTLRHKSLPADLDGLLFVAPFIVDAKNIYNAGGGIDAATPATETVDADGSYIDPDTGLITPAQANVLRIGSGIDKASRHLGGLFEGTRTNKCLQSEDFATTWTATRSTVTANDIAAPDDNLTADKIVEDSTASATHLITQSISVTSGQKVVISVFAKKGERSEILLQAGGTAAPANANVWFDLNAGTKGTVGGGVDDSGIDDMGDGWYRCWLVFTADATDTFSFDILLGSGSETSSYNGDGSSGVYIWGAQCEENVPFLSSYIKTTTASVTRVVEDIRYDNTSEANLKASAGTFYIAHTPEYNGADLSDNGVLFDCRVPDAADGWFVQSQASSDAYNVFVKSGSSTVADMNSAVASVRGATVVVCFSWKLNEFTLYVDGVQKVQDTTGNAPTAVNPSMFMGQNRNNDKPDFSNLAHCHIYDSVHDAARILKNTKEIQSWLGI